MFVIILFYVVDDTLNPPLEISVGPLEVKIPDAVIDDDDGLGEEEVHEVYLPVVHGVPGQDVPPIAGRNYEIHDTGD